MTSRLTPDLAETAHRQVPGDAARRADRDRTVPRTDRAIEGLDPEERALLIEALTTLRFTRGQDWLSASRLADERGQRRPSLDESGVAAIKRLARRLGGHALHWTGAAP